MRHWDVDIGGRTLRRVLEQFAAGELVPGGGAAAGIAGAVGVSLLRKAAAVSGSGRRAPGHAGELQSAAERLVPIGERLLALAHDDVEAYARVLAALRWPRDTPARQHARTAALQDALRGATDVPLDIMQACGEALACGTLIAPGVTAAARSSLAVGADLLGVTLRGAAGAVEANLRHLAGPDAALLSDRRRRLEADASAHLRSCHRLAGTDSMYIGR